MINLIDTLSDESLEKLLSVFQSLGSHTDHNNNIKVEDFKVILGEILNIPDSDERLSVLCKKVRWHFLILANYISTCTDRYRRRWIYK